MGQHPGCGGPSSDSIGMLCWRARRWCGLCRCCCVEGGDAEEVVDRGGELEPGPVALAADVAKLAAAADGLDPPEGFLDPFPDPHARLVAPVAGGPPVDG